MTKNDFQRALLKWYRRHGRDLPWRRTRDPYAILVSEIMLQQTQVATVLPYYNNWLRRFPTFAALAGAAESDVLHAWQGLGYYARARNLHATAKVIVHRHRGHFPEAIDEIQKLPGIGKYTAHAVATFAFDRAVPIVEANTSRVLSRLFDLRIPIDSTKGRNALWNYATALVPRTSAAKYNSALLDLGALVCVAANPRCQICPIKKFCRAEDPRLLPIKRPRPEMRQLTERHAFIRRGNRILLQNANHRWCGMWILPQLNGSHQKKCAIHESAFSFTHHRITLQVFSAKSFSPLEHAMTRWFTRPQLDRIPIPSPHRRAIEQLLVAA